MARSRQPIDDHLDPEQLLGLAESGVVALGAEAHLERCGDCRGELGRLRTLIADLRAPRLELPSAEARRRIGQLFEPRPGVARRVIEHLGRLLSPPPALALAGVRGAARPPARLLFGGPGLEIDLELADSPGGLSLTGQVLAADRAAPEPLPAMVWAERGGELLAEAPVDDDGLFQLGPLAGPGCDLVLDLGSERLRLRLPERDSRP